MIKPILGVWLVCSTLICNALMAQTNLIDMQGWTVGQGNTGVFQQSGANSENIREWGDGPNGKRVVVWKSAPAGDASNDGGWETQGFAITHSNMYRYAVWMKKTNSNDGYSYFGCTNVANLNGTVNNNPFFWIGDLPELNKWYLLVGYVHSSGDVSTTSYGGIYDGVTGAKVVEITDFKFTTSSTTTAHRTYLFFDANTSDRQYFYAPRVDLVNGNEPSVAALLGIQSSASESAYFSGSIGVKTNPVSGFDLAVNGKVRAREIKVDAETWPDYVFAGDYVMPSLTETETHIKEKGHLPGIPSAAEVTEKGIELGEMNKKLLQKIEELTLHLIEMKKEILGLNNKVEILSKRNRNNLK